MSFWFEIPISTITSHISSAWKKTYEELERTCRYHASLSAIKTPTAIAVDNETALYAMLLIDSYLCKMLEPHNKSCKLWLQRHGVDFDDYASIYFTSHLQKNVKLSKLDQMKWCIFVLWIWFSSPWCKCHCDIACNYEITCI